MGAFVGALVDGAMAIDIYHDTKEDVEKAIKDPETAKEIINSKEVQNEVQKKVNEALQNNNKEHEKIEKQMQENLDRIERETELEQNKLVKKYYRIRGTWTNGRELCKVSEKSYEEERKQYPCKWIYEENHFRFMEMGADDKPLTAKCSWTKLPKPDLTPGYAFLNHFMYFWIRCRKADFDDEGFPRNYGNAIYDYEGYDAVKCNWASARGSDV